MEVIKTPIEGLLELQPRIFEDNRGSFFESFNEAQFNKLTGKTIHFVQDNQSISKKGVLRGLHFQQPPMAQGKLVRVVAGSALDVAVDLRKDSSTYGKYHAVLLEGTKNNMFWIPEGFAHGFLSLEENTVFSYKCTNYYAPDCEATIMWNDQDLNIDWGNSVSFISDKDEKGMEFRNFVTRF